ncbi:anthranilate synthase component I family protein [Fluviicola sp.]|uniref:anthranilate synthase component I family protein n=1 Tax=Fluviicola sp. TaxID=1917219 RepID=UPI00261C0A2B|nr:anthranilate synthase component I family protein [Fluviicola sp.]
MHIYTQEYSFNADNYTSVGLYLSFKNRFRSPCLLESNDYNDRTSSKSFIGLNPLIDIQVFQTEICIQELDSVYRIPVEDPQKITQQIQNLLNKYSFQNNFEHNGFLSYFSFEFSHFEEHISTSESQLQLPLARFTLFQYLVVLDHFHDRGSILFNAFEPTSKSHTEFPELLRFNKASNLPFELVNEEKTTVSEDDFLQLVRQAKTHIYRGDVFQLVVSRPFEQAFFGDDFQVYRQLRRLNPSPYLFYLDMESYRLFGSSPETQIQLKNGIAEIHPIAGTVRKTGDSNLDKQLVQQLTQDEKENAEHTMLVDLARNDLSKFCTSVKITSYKEVQHFSHVIHLVSKVTAQTEESALSLFNGTFPAGTLSGTPKPKALELLNHYEKTGRGFYGGAVGFIHSNGNMNLAIIIRSALSSNNILRYQAGAGIVLDSVPENELEEVSNKLGAIRKAIQCATKPDSL